MPILIRAILLVKIIMIVMNSVAMMMTVLEKMQGSRKIEVYKVISPSLWGIKRKSFKTPNPT